MADYRTLEERIASADEMDRLESASDVVGLAKKLTSAAAAAVRLRAIHALQRLRTPRRTRHMLEPLLAALTDTDMEVRRHAAGLLGRLGDSRATEPLLVLFSTGEAPVSLAAALSLDRLSPGWERSTIAPHGLAGLVQALRSQVRRLEWDRHPWGYDVEIKALLDRIGVDRMRDALLETVHDRQANYYQRRDAALNLQLAKHDRATRSLLAALADPAFDMRAELARALGFLGDEQAVQALGVASRDSDAAVRAESVEALGRMQASTATEVALDAIADPDPTVRAAGAGVLGLSSEDRSMRALVELLQDAVHEVGMSAAAALGARPLPASAAESMEALQGRPLLAPLLALMGTLPGERWPKDANLRPDEWVAFALWKSVHAQQMKALRALAGQGERQAIPLLRQILFKEDEPSQLNPVRYGVQAGQAERGLAWGTVVDLGGELRRAAAGALGKLGGPEAERALLDALEPGREVKAHFERALKRAIVDGLKDLATPGAMAAAQQWLDDD